MTNNPFAHLCTHRGDLERISSNLRWTLNVFNLANPNWRGTDYRCGSRLFCICRGTGTLREVRSGKRMEFRPGYAYFIPRNLLVELCFPPELVFYALEFQVELLPGLDLFRANDRVLEYKPEPYTPGKCQNTYPAKLTSLVFERWKAFRGDPSKGLVFVPCELIDHNGSTLKQCMKHYAADWKLPEEFSSWLDSACLFVNTLVDRIVAGYPRGEAEKIESELGYEDKLLDCGEIFHFFVIEGPQSILKELPFTECGLNVIVTDNQAPYRTRKVRFLNGAHTADVPAAILGGLTFVDEMMDDPVFGKMVRKAIYDEIFHTVELPDEEKKFFADSIVERFRNPFAHHRLLSISLNSISKWKVRVLPSLLDYVRIKGELPRVLAFSLAALLRFYRLELDGEGKASGSYREIRYPVSDSPDVLAFFAETAKLPLKEAVGKALANTSFWDMDLNTVPGLAELVTEKVALIDNAGIREAVKSIL